MKKTFLLSLLALGAALGCSKKPQKTSDRDSYVYEPVRIASAYIPLIEKPDAARALLLGDGALSLTNYFAHAGVKCFTVREGRFDLIVVACSSMTKRSCNRLCEMLSDNGVLAWLMDAQDVTAEQFLERFRGFALNEAHLWMPGERHWLLVGRKTPRKIRLSHMLDLFVRERAFEDLARAHAGSLSELFANYVGSANDVVPAFFNLSRETIVSPELFLPKDVPQLDWVDASDVDDDIRRSVLADIRSFQIMRREAVRACMAARVARNKADEEAVAANFAKVALRNPNDLFVLERIDRLDRNARGFLEVGKVLLALKCYETMVLIRPNDAKAVHNFGMCLKKIGKRDLADKILKRAEELMKGEEAARKAKAR